jgi:hypothetical protein
MILPDGRCSYARRRSENVQCPLILGARASGSPSQTVELEHQQNSPLRMTIRPLDRAKAAVNQPLVGTRNRHRATTAPRPITARPFRPLTVGARSSPISINPSSRRECGSRIRRPDPSLPAMCTTASSGTDSSRSRSSLLFTAPSNFRVDSALLARAARCRSPASASPAQASGRYRPSSSLIRRLECVLG